MWLIYLYNNLFIGDIVFALGYITATFHAYQAMNDQGRIKYNQITLITTIIGSCMCFITGNYSNIL